MPRRWKPGFTCLLFASICGYISFNVYVYALSNVITWRISNFDPTNEGATAPVSRKDIQTDVKSTRTPEEVSKKKILNNLCRIETNYDHLPDDFDFLITPSKKCNSISSTQSISFLVGVESSVLNFEQRAAVRQTWANKDLLNRFSSRVIFLIGTNETAEFQEMLNRENKQYDDLVQGSFIEHYRNLTLKTIMFFRWSQCFCKSVDYVIKTDDDVIVNLKKIYTIVKSLPKTGLYLGHMQNRSHVIRRSRHRWYTSFEAYPKDYYPRYASGALYILSKMLQENVMNICRHTQQDTSLQKMHSLA
ncbi:beta-1,3-galactosyltransferase 1-like [Saccoglossus kowalevskii]|uniref:Hexosyltransferase n=1 Tax=Saccoglossus kowalevskii TaxID=10224 RepID=A0ABM0LXS2_SACKO|nr:PREDICTED: beta-1,3-galactosyltransferase 1-like [Saccoglossus kowalevskii]